MSQPQSAESRVATSDDTPNGGRLFVKWFALTLAGALLCVAGMNVLLDPVAAFGTGIIRPVTPLDRDDKAALFARLQPAPTALIVGSSVVGPLDPLCVASQTGAGAFNFALNGATIEDDAAAIAFVESMGGRLDRVLIGVDPQALQQNDIVDDRLLHSRSLARFVHRTPLRPREAVAQALSLGTTVYSLTSIRQALFPRPLLVGVTSRGQVVNTVLDQQRARGSLDREALLIEQSRSFHNRLRGFTRLSPRRVATLDSLIRTLHERGIRVDAFMVPFAPELRRRLSDTPWASRSNDVALLLQHQATLGLIRFADLRELSSFGGDSTEFYDGVHMTPQNARLFLARLLDTQPCALSP